MTFTNLSSHFPSTSLYFPPTRPPFLHLFSSILIPPPHFLNFHSCPPTPPYPPILFSPPLSPSTHLPHQPPLPFLTIHTPHFPSSSSSTCVHPFLFLTPSSSSSISSSSTISSSTVSFTPSVLLRHSLDGVPFGHSLAPSRA